MMKSALNYSVLIIFFFVSQASAGAAALAADMPWATDTIPVTERFDEPLSGAVKSPDNRKDLFKQEIADRKVIPLTNIELDTTYRGLLEIPEGYTGFKVEIMSTSMPLPAEHDLFFQHGKVTMEQLGEDQFSYLIGHFEAKGQAESFRASFLEGRYPESVVVGYIEGQRQKK